MRTIIKVIFNTFTVDGDSILSQKKQEIIDEWSASIKEDRPMILVTDRKYDIELYADYSDGIIVDASR